MGAIAHATAFSTSGATSTVDVTITSTTATNALVVCAGSDVVLNSVTATGATFANQNSVTGRGSVFSAYNVSASITTVTLNFTGYKTWSGYVLEVSGVASASDPWDTDNTRTNGYNTTNLGTGAITTGATGAGIAIAFFLDYYGAATNCTAGSGWSGGTFANHNYYEYRASAANTGYGGTTGQATASGSGLDMTAWICNLFDSGGAPAAASPVPFGFTLVGVQ